MPKQAPGEPINNKLPLQAPGDPITNFLDMTLLGLKLDLTSEPDILNVRKVQGFHIFREADEYQD